MSISIHPFCARTLDPGVVRRPDQFFLGITPSFSLCLFCWLTLPLSSSGPPGPAEVEGPPGPGHGHSGSATTRQWRGDSEGEAQRSVTKSVTNIATCGPWGRDGFRR